MKIALGLLLLSPVCFALSYLLGYYQEVFRYQQAMKLGLGKFISWNDVVIHMNNSEGTLTVFDSYAGRTVTWHRSTEISEISLEHIDNELEDCFGVMPPLYYYYCSIKKWRATFTRAKILHTHLGGVIH